MQGNPFSALVNGIGNLGSFSNSLPPLSAIDGSAFIGSEPGSSANWSPADWSPFAQLGASPQPAGPDGSVADASPDDASTGEGASKASPLLLGNDPILTGGTDGGQNADLFHLIGSGDFSDGYHDLMRDTYYDFYKSHGYPVEKEVRFRGLEPGPSSKVDLMVQVPPWRLPRIEEYKTGASPTYTKQQAWVYPQIMIGHSASDDPKITTFGLPLGEPLPPLPIFRIWDRMDGSRFRIEKLEPEMVAPTPGAGPWPLR